MWFIIAYSSTPFLFNNRYFVGSFLFTFVTSIENEIKHNICDCVGRQNCYIKENKKPYLYPQYVHYCPLTEVYLIHKMFWKSALLPISCDSLLLYWQMFVILRVMPVGGIKSGVFGMLC
jgi:hypothetical protein